MKCARIACLMAVFMGILMGTSVPVIADTEHVPTIWHCETSDPLIANFASYELGSNEGMIVVDGKLTHEDILGLPFSRITAPPANHTTMQTPLTGWVKDDGSNLYVAMDLTIAKNECFSRGDASVYIRQPGGVIEFRLSKAIPAFAMRGGFETPSMKRRHRVFEFKIPLDRLRIDRGNLEIAFVAHGDEQG